MLSVNQLSNSDELEGFIRNPFAFYFPIQRGFSGSYERYPLRCFSGCNFTQQMFMHDGQKGFNKGLGRYIVAQFRK